ncbi:MAG: 2-C-methyl-D-erythritol 4-phosphate cytidylyltransferase [Desulfomonile tiedjei]|nr:2-C-methyl-D-erythritol 4-phosphate cytidylyltransferase [Desulfomonile tiedjei]
MIRAALVTAGGHGTRMGSRFPKQYLDLNGLPVLARTLLIFQAHPLVDTIVVTVPPGDEEFCLKEIVVRHNLRKVAEVVAGGADRQASVYHGLERLTHTDLVAIHDGVRPLVSPEVITRTIQAAEQVGAAAAGIPVRETVKKRIGAHLETIPRSDLWLARTPQAFRTALIWDAHRRALSEGFRGTDDAALVERLGHEVEIVEDTEENIKITTPADLAVARFWLGATAGLDSPARDEDRESRPVVIQPDARGPSK